MYHHLLGVVIILIFFVKGYSQQKNKFPDIKIEIINMYSDDSIKIGCNFYADKTLMGSSRGSGSSMFGVELPVFCSGNLYYIVADLLDLHPNRFLNIKDYQKYSLYYRILVKNFNENSTKEEKLRICNKILKFFNQGVMKYEIDTVYYELTVKNEELFKEFIFDGEETSLETKILKKRNAIDTLEFNPISSTTYRIAGNWKIIVVADEKLKGNYFIKRFRNSSEHPMSFEELQVELLKYYGLVLRKKVGVLDFYKFVDY